MQSITIKNFKGINLAENRWQEAFSKYVKGMDFYGLGDNSTQISYPGVLQPARTLSANTNAASPSGIINTIVDMAVYQPNGGLVHPYAVTNSQKLYTIDGGQNVWVSACLISSAPGGLATYAGKLYYTDTARLGQWDGTTGNANFKTFSNTLTNASLRKIKVFNSNLYILNGNAVARFDGTTLTDVLTISSEFSFREMEVFSNRLYLIADNGQFSRMYVWDGSSPFNDIANNMLDEQYSPTLVASNGLLWMITNRASSIFVNSVYVSQGGSSFQQVVDLPIQRNGEDSIRCGASVYEGGVLIGAADSGSANYEDGVAGAWYINRTEDGTYQSCLLFNADKTLTQMKITAIMTWGADVYIGSETAQSGVYAVNKTQANLTNDTAIWQSLPIDAGSTNDKMWTTLKINFDALTTGNTVVVKYRLNDATAWTTLKTFASTDPAANRGQYIPIGRTSRTIDIRIEIQVSASGDGKGTRVHAFTLNYLPTGN